MVIDLQVPPGLSSAQAVSKNEASNTRDRLPWSLDTVCRRVSGFGKRVICGIRSVKRSGVRKVGKMLASLPSLPASGS